MAPSKSQQKQKKEKIFHPDSRKAAQGARTQIRKNKLSEAASQRKKKFASQGVHTSNLL